MRTSTIFLAVALLGVACKSGMQSPTVQFRMKDHEKHGVAIRDAVARGDLDAAKREAAGLALLSIEGTIDPAWKQRLDAMNVAAARVANAMDITDAAHGLGPLAKTCGDCHTMLGRPWPAVPPQTGQASGVRPFMVRHQWAASQMWDGLAIPSDDAWKAGAHALAEEPLSPEALTPGKTPVPKVGDLEQSVHDLARKAEAVDKVDARMQLYGDAMATCAECHKWLGGGPPVRAEMQH
jgi:cytochrome c553